MAENSLRWSARSVSEYEKLIDHLLNEWGTDITLQVMERIRRSTERITRSPEQFPLFVKSKKIQRCVVSPQTSIYFKVSKTDIFIISIYDNRRDPKKRKL